MHFARSKSILQRGVALYWECYVLLYYRMVSMSDYLWCFAVAVSALPAARCRPSRPSSGENRIEMDGYQKFIKLAFSVKCNVATAANIMLIAGLEKERSLAVRHCELDAALWELLGNHLSEAARPTLDT